MSEFEEFDLRFWVKCGFVERAPERIREFKRKRPNGRASLAVSLMAAIATFNYSSPVLASQVQSSWDTSTSSAYAPGRASAVAVDPSLIPGNPQDYWGALSKDIARWQVAVESDPIDDVPPIF